MHPFDLSLCYLRGGLPSNERPVRHVIAKSLRHGVLSHALQRASHKNFVIEPGALVIAVVSPPKSPLTARCGDRRGHYLLREAHK